MMPVPETQRTDSSRALTRAANVAFVPIGVVTVLLGPMLPALSSRWSLNYSQAGSLFTAQFLASTMGVAVSGALVSHWGFRFALNAGLLVMAAGIAGLSVGSHLWGMMCIAVYGAGLGLAVPAANLLVAEVNPKRRSAALNLLNFSWSVGAVACPFLVAAAARSNRVAALMIVVAGILLVVMLGIASMSSRVVEPVLTGSDNKPVTINWGARSLFVLSALFFLYVGTENAFGGWIASYAKSLGRMPLARSVMMPSFFYSALLVGRWIAPWILRKIDEVKLARTGILAACAGMAGLLFSRATPGVVGSAIVTGFGLAAVYPITISLLSREFGPAASRVGSVMFTMANLGGACLPWFVGYASSRYGSLKVGLAVPLIAGAAIFVLYFSNWKSAHAGQSGS
jgi:FHS family glucose/mannose:H+ symporter-like MFS transporter